MSRPVCLYIACSLDGYIAKPNDDLSFLSIVEKQGEDYGYTTFVKNVDTILIGRKTYDWVVNEMGDYPNADKEVYVITRTPRDSKGSVKFYTGDLASLVHELKNKEGLHIYCDGGAELVNALLKNKLIDEMIISYIPVLLGDGVKLFTENYGEQHLQLVSSKSYESGLVQVHYKVN